MVEGELTGNSSFIPSGGLRGYFHFETITLYTKGCRVAGC